jgi:biopolymer transport protein ExbD
MRLGRIPLPEGPSLTPAIAAIVMLLALFFLLSADREVDRTRVELPRASYRVAAVPGAAVVVMARNEQGALVYRFSDGSAWSHEVGGPEAVAREAARIAAVEPDRQFVVKADGNAPFEQLDELLDQLRRAGVRNVLLVARHAAGNGRSAS